MKFYKIKYDLYFNTTWNNGKVYSGAVIEIGAKSGEIAQSVFIQRKSQQGYKVEILSVKEFKPRKTRFLYV